MRFRHAVRSLWNPPWPRASVPLAAVCVTALLLGDALLIAADVLQRRAVLHDARFLVTRERGFGELFQYGKFLLLAGVLGAWSARLRSRGALLFAALFAYLFADDALAIHERAGARIAAALTLPAWDSLRPEQLGELLYLSLVGSALLAGAALCVWRSGRRDRHVVLLLAVGIAMLAVPGVGVDLLHSLVDAPLLRAVLAVVEDGGEMIVTSGLVGMSLALMPSRG